MARSLSLPSFARRNTLPQFAIAVILMLIALAVRLAIAPVDAGLQYLTFFPAVALSAVVGGAGPGLLAVLAGLGFATFIFVPPYWTVSFEVVEKSLWSNLVFIADGLVICASIEGMHRYREKFQKETQETKRAAERIIAINKELDDFTYIASHDLKEPLRGIHNYASFLKEDCGGTLPAEGLQYLVSIQRLAERMTHLIDRLLEYSRLGSSEIKMEPVDLDVIVAGVIEDLSALRDEGVEIRLANSLGKAEGNALRIGEVFQNLISNAAKYNDNPRKTVEIGRDDSKRNPVYYVRDNGIGIPEQHRENVFRIFKRLHEHNKYGGGMGAGLTIVKKIIERHGGRIWLESVPGEGTIFYFTLNGSTDAGRSTPAHSDR
jgi:signal transduction histidine kinase